MTGPGVQDPTTVGPYRLVQRLGEGGMGVVHLALDPGGRAVALKLLRAQVAADPEARQRLVREVETLRRVRHARVAEVLDADVAGQVPYLVTRFVPGRTLDQHVRDTGPLTADQIADVGRGLAAALQAIHAVGVVHRDIKPANVMFVDGQPVLIDFGIAHLADESRITVTGLVMGTPGYLSPEVIDGHPVSMATDWWGWAATLAFAASGRPPFGTGPMEVVLDRVRRGAADLDGVDPRLRPVLAGALVADPSRRAGPGHLLAGLAAALGSPGDPAARSAAASAPTIRQVPSRLAPAMQPTVPAAGNGRGGPPTKRYPYPRGAGSPPSAASPFGGPPPFGGLAPAPGLLPGSATPLPRVSGPATPVQPAPLPGTPPGGFAPVPASAEPDQPDGGTRPGAWQPPARGIGPVRPTGTLLGVLAALTAVATVSPGGALAITAALMVVARAVDRTALGLWRRRQDAGPRAGDIPVAVVAFPWRLVQAAAASAFALVLPVLVAISTAFIGGAVAHSSGANSSRAPTMPVPLAVATVAALLTAWWGPGGGSLRRGSRAMARAAVRRTGVGVAVWAVLALVVVSALIVLGQHPQPTIRLPGFSLDIVPSRLRHGPGGRPLNVSRPAWLPRSRSG